MPVTVARRRNSRGGLYGDAFASVGERYGLLADIVMQRGCRSLAEILRVELASIPFGPARELLGAMQAEPHLPLDHWLGRGPRVTVGLADAWVQLRWWVKVPRGALHGVRYPDADLASGRRIHDLRNRYSEVAQAPVNDTYANVIAAVMESAGRLWTGKMRPSDLLVGACGPASWLITEGSEFIADSRARANMTKLHGTAGVN